MVVSATVHDADLLYRAIPPGRVPWMGMVLRPPHLPFQAIYTRVAGVVGQSAADHPDNGQSRKAELELVHIELLIIGRRVRSRAIALNRLRTLPAMCQSAF
jgi:hypothetical protein